MVEHKFKPFLWFKEDVTQLIYGGKRLKIIEACQKYGVKLTKLRTCVMMVTHRTVSKWL
jgi:hypothetical protein